MSLPPLRGAAQAGVVLLPRTPLATTGDIRGADDMTVKARNAGNTADLDVVTLDGADGMAFGDAADATTTVQGSTVTATGATAVAVTATAGTVTLTATAGSDNKLAISGATGVSTLGGETSAGLAVNGTDVVRATASAISAAQPVTVTQSGATTTPDDALVLSNATASTGVATVHVSPTQEQHGTAYDGAASQGIRARSYVQPFATDLGVGGVVQSTRRHELSRDGGSTWSLAAVDMTPDLDVLSPYWDFDPDVLSTVSESSLAVASVTNRGSGGGTLAQGTGANKPTLCNWRGLRAMYFDGGDWLASDQAAAHWRNLSDGAGATLVVVYEIAQQTATNTVILDTLGSTADDLATGKGMVLWHNGTVNQFRTIKTGPTVVKSQSGRASCGYGAIANILRTKAGGSPFDITNWDSGANLGGAVAAAFASEAPASTLYVGAGSTAQAWKLTGYVARIWGVKSYLTNRQLSEIVIPHLIGRYKIGFVSSTA